MDTKIYDFINKLKLNIKILKKKFININKK